jgi:excisionase family DNA binding protein
MSSDGGRVDIEQVAAHPRVNEESVYRWIDEKGFPTHRVGRLFRFTLSEMASWVVSGGGEGETKWPRKRRGRDDRAGAGR